MCHPSVFGGLRLLFELEENGHWPLQHMAGVYHDVHHPKCCKTAQVAMKFAKKMTGQPTHGPKVTPAQ